jgi:peptidoglycan-associated lipoprotein
MPRPTVTLTAAVLLLAACGGKPKPEAPPPDTGREHSTSAASADGGRAERERAEREHAERERVTNTLAQPIYFGYDQATLSQAARAALDAKAGALRAMPGLRLVLDGHTDEHGSDEYNLALGMRRATAAQRYLAQSGIASSRLEIQSYGEERPVDPAHTGAAWTANRRVEFSAPAAISLR